MPTNTQGMILFVEDVREELGGKTSLMGVMGSEIEVNASELDVYCVMLLVEKQSGKLDISGRITIDGVPEDFRQPGPLKKTLDLLDSPNGSFVQIVGKIPRIPVGNGTVKIEASLSIGDGERELEGALLITPPSPSADTPQRETKRKLPLKRPLPKK